MALADLTGRLPLMRVSDRLTDIAELIVQCCMDLAWKQMTRVHGVPHCGRGEADSRVVKVAVAGYGKLGGLELGYGSDLDLVFLHDSTGRVPADPAAIGRSTTACSSCGSDSASCIFSPCIRLPAACTRSTCGCGRTARAGSS